MRASIDRLIFTFTDFGSAGPYLAQIEAAVLSEAPDARVLHLLADAPRFDPKRSSYLLAALLQTLPESVLVLAVVDPGVGSDRLPLLIELGDRILIGPDNGLMVPAIAQAERSQVYRIDWRPERLSASFQGRDLFAPVAAKVVLGLDIPLAPLGASGLVGAHAPADLFEIIYFDHYGNAFTGVRGSQLPDGARLSVNGLTLNYARTFSDARDQVFWYRNSCGLVELAARAQSARELLAIEIGTELQLLEA